MLILFLGLLSCLIDNSFSELPIETSLPPPNLNEKVDVIVALDCSGSMADNVITYYGISQIPIELDNYTNNWQLALITTDKSDIENQYIINSNTKDPGWTMIENMDYMKKNGGQLEAGVDAVDSYLNNNNFYRGEKLIIVIVSDENDQSTQDPSVIGDLSNTKIVTVVSTIKSEERTEPCTDEYGERYLSVADVAIDICSIEAWSIFSKDTG